MQYAVKGSDEQWTKAIDEKDITERNGQDSQHPQQVKEKRKLDSDDIQREIDNQTPKSKKQQDKKRSSKKSKKRKSS